MTLTSLPVQRPAPALDPQAPTAHDLALLVRRVAVEPRLWRPHVRFDAGRHRTLIGSPRGIDVWLLTWLPSQGSELHDHGDSAAAYAVVGGALTEVRADDAIGVWSTPLQAPAVRVVEPGAVHAVRNDLVAPALSLHAYGPRLSRTTYYDLADGAIVPTRTVLGDEPDATL